MLFSLLHAWFTKPGNGVVLSAIIQFYYNNNNNVITYTFNVNIAENINSKYILNKR